MTDINYQTEPFNKTIQSLLQYFKKIFVEHFYVKFFHINYFITHTVIDNFEIDLFATYYLTQCCGFRKTV